MATTGKALAYLALPATLKYLRAQAKPHKTVVNLSAHWISMHYRSDQLSLKVQIAKAADAIAPVIGMVLDELPSNSAASKSWQVKAPAHKRQQVIRDLVTEAVTKELAALLRAPAYGFTHVTSKQVTL